MINSIEYISNKKYQIITTVENQLIGFYCSKNSKINTVHIFFDSDNLEDCINYLFNKNIITFYVPIDIYGTNIENIKKKKIISNNILIRYEDGDPIYEDNVLIGFIEEIDPLIIKNNKINFLLWKYPDRPIRLTISVDLSRNDYKDFISVIFARQSLFIYNSNSDSNIIYFEYLETLEGLFSLDQNKNIICSDPRLKIEQLDNNFIIENNIIKHFN